MTERRLTESMMLQSAGRCALIAHRALAWFWVQEIRVQAENAAHESEKFLCTEARRLTH